MLNFIGLLCGIIVTLTALVVQVGWHIHSIQLVQINSDFSPMQFNTALCFLFCGINLICFKNTSRGLRSTGLIAVVLALIILLQYPVHVNFGIDTLFIMPFTQTNSPAIGRMSVTTAINFLFMGSLIFLAANYQKNKIIRLLIILLSSAIIALSIVPLLAYLSGIQTAYPWRNLTGMAVHTAMSFILLGIGTICRLWAYSKRKTPFFLMVPVVLCLITISFSLSGAIHTYENLKYQEFLQEESYYRSRGAGVTPPAFNTHFLRRDSSYISFFVLFFGLLTAILVSLTIYFHIKWRQNVKALELSQERLNLAVTGTTDGLFDWNVNTGDFYYSPRFEEVLGYRVGSLDPHFTQFVELIHPKDRSRFQQELLVHFKNNTPIDIELRLREKNNSYTWFSFRGTPTQDSDSKRMAGFVTDISARNEIDKLKDEFISTVSHELRTPMTSINGSLSLVLGGHLGSCEGKIKDLLLIAERNCKRLLRLINDILDIEKIESGKIEFHLNICDLGSLVKESITHNQMFAEQYALKIDFLPLDDIQVYVDIDRLMQVLTNLISNAVKFAKAGSVVLVSMSLEKQMVRVSIMNEGAGIPDNFRGNIFQKFSQADSAGTGKLKGSGLGLSISKAIIQKLGGNLDFTSVANERTTFYFDLPIVNA